MKYNKKINVLILSPYFLPGYRAGGPIQSLKNIIDHLSDRINFFVITPDHDLGSKDKYLDVRSDQWNSLRGVSVYYYGNSIKSLIKLFRTLRKLPHDVRYYNSFFHFKTTLLPLILEKIGLLQKKPSVLAPRGELAAAALNLKKRKKFLFLKLAKFFKLYSNVNWHVSSPIEKNQVNELFEISVKRNVEIIPNLPPKINISADQRLSSKNLGLLKLVFISRIAKKKNLLKAISLLKEAKGTVKFDIYGPKEDIDYFNECMRMANSLPENIEVRYSGMLEHSQTIPTLKKYDFLFFPTQDENFGHIILESFLAGTPVIISNRTPWLGLEKLKAGWDIPLENEIKFQKVINQCIDMDQQNHQILCNGALNLAKDYLEKKEIVEQTFQMFAKIAK